MSDGENKQAMASQPRGIAPTFYLNDGLLSGNHNHGRQQRKGSPK